MRMRFMLACSLVMASATVVAKVDEATTSGLREPSAFVDIRNEKKRSLALFAEIGKVFQSPRCLNCHPRTDSPTQGDALMLHAPPITRGRDGHGVTAMRCQTCHGATNVAFANGNGSIPGDPEWHLAPLTMAWQGRSAGEICRQIKDPARNGGKTLAALIEHNRGDHLVGWAWHPGPGRMPAPGTQQRFGELTQAWVDTGAHCPD